MLYISRFNKLILHYIISHFSNTVRIHTRYIHSRSSWWILSQYTTSADKTPCCMLHVHLLAKKHLISLYTIICPICSSSAERLMGACYFCTLVNYPRQKVASRHYARKGENNYMVIYGHNRRAFSFFRKSSVSE